MKITDLCNSKVRDGGLLLLLLGGGVLADEAADSGSSPEKVSPNRDPSARLERPLEDGFKSGQFVVAGMPPELGLR